ncbi:MAG TPA: Ig-like domain-containing protein [Candidatus Saccharimonadales bacterium]|nr:Ig-like domain-containing protein [Candidatus Saccharimonadales bacterium]
MLPAFAATSTLNGHEVVLDASGKIVPWVAQHDQAYSTVSSLAWDYLLNKVPRDPATGQPAYYSQSYLFPDNGQLGGWPSNPAGMNAMLIESAIEYYQYSGDSRVITFARNIADHQLAQGMTLPTDNWANVPYASGDAGSMTYKGASYGNSTGVGDGVGYIQPDKVGELGLGFLQLYQQTGITTYRDAAVNAANALVSHVRVGNATQSPWPFRVKAADNTVREQYSAHVISSIELFDKLIKLNLGTPASYQTTRQTAWNWLLQYPMANNVWANYFEDVGTRTGTDNINSLNPMMTARYLLQYPETDPNWLAHVRGLISWTEANFGESQYGATTIKEQMVFPFAMGSHSSRYASVNALLYEKTGDQAAKEKAFRAYNWSTYMMRSSGVGIDGPSVNNQWFTDSYGDYVRHFMVGMGAVTDWAPAAQTHLLESGSTVTNISYSPTLVNYTTYDGSSVEKLKVAAVPTSVNVDGVAISQRSDLAAEGWTYDPATAVLQIRHDSGTAVAIGLNGTPANQLPTVTLGALNANYNMPASFDLNASASDADGTISKVEFYQNGVLQYTDTAAPYSYTVANLAAGTYSFTAKAYDDQDAATTTSATTVTITDPVQAAGWTGVDIGPVGVPGSTSLNNGVATVRGSGSDIWDGADSFHFGYQQLTGDGEIKARIATQQNTQEWALAGVMIRDSLAPGSRHALAAMTPSHGLSFDYRATTGGNTSYTAGGSGTVPYWLRLVRSGNTITASKSTNGTTWTSMGSASITMGSTVYIGLAVTSHANGTLGTATFDNISFTGQPPAGDTTPPAFSNVSAKNPNQNGVTIAWTTSEPATSQIDYGTTTAYGTSTATNTSLETVHTQVVAGLDANTTYHYRVRSADAAGNSAVSGDFTFTTPGIPDSEAPTAPTNLQANTPAPARVDLTWSASTDNVAVDHYIVKRDGVTIATPVNAGFSDTAVQPNTGYTYAVFAVDAANNISIDNPLVTVTTPGDTTAPSVPGSLTATPLSATQVALSWTASTDNVSVARYTVWRNGVSLGTVTTPGYTDTTAAANTTYNYTVTAQDPSGNNSAASNTATITTPNAQTLAVDVQVVKHGTSAATTVVSPAITTTGTNELLVAFVSSDGPSGSGTSSFSGVTGGGLTWTLRKRVNTQAGTSEIWTAPATAKLTNVTVTATRTGSYRSSMVVTAFKGASLAGTGATGGANAATGAPSASLTTTQANSWVWGVGNDWDNPTARTVGANQTMVDQFMTSTGDTLWVQRQNAATPAAGTAVTISDTAPTNDRWNLAVIEIIPAN